MLPLRNPRRISLNDTGFVFGATTDLCRTFRRPALSLVRTPRVTAAVRSAYLALLRWMTPPSRRRRRNWWHCVSRCSIRMAISRLVLFATLGDRLLPPGQGTAAGEQPTFGMHTFPLLFTRYRSWIEQGVMLATPKVRAIPAVCVDPHIKTRCMQLAGGARNSPHESGARPLLLDLEGNVTETASSNFLLVRRHDHLPAADWHSRRHQPRRRQQVTPSSASRWRVGRYRWTNAMRPTRRW